MDCNNLGECRQQPPSSNIFAGIIASPRDANEWLANSAAVAELVKQGYSQISIANALGISDSVVGIWKKAGSRWPQVVKSKILQRPELFPAPLLNALAKKLWTDIDAIKKSKKSDGRRNARPKLSLLAAIDLILDGKKLRNDRRGLVDINSRLEGMVNTERGRNQTLRRDMQKLSEANSALVRQLSVHRMDDLIRQNNELKKLVVKLSVGKNVKRQKSSNEMYMENNLLDVLRMRVDLDYSQKTLLIMAPNQDMLDDLCEKILRLMR